MKSRSILPTISFLSFSLTLSACQVLPSTSAPGTRDEQDGRAPPIYAEGWSELVVISGFESGGGAEVKFDTSGHFETSRNACFREEQGSISLSEWNQLGAALNALAASPDQEEETCFPAGEARWHFDGTAKLAKGEAPERVERELLTERGREVCTRAVNVDAAKRLVEVLDRALMAAALEGCPEAAPRP